MYIPKRYGQSSVAQCPFCGGNAFAKNAQGVPCCTKHKEKKLPDLKCACGAWLDQRESKFGVFYTCMRCGAVSFSKMMSVNADRILEALSPRREPPKPSQVLAASPSQVRMQSLHDRIREKIRRGEPLTPDELELL